MNAVTPPQCMHNTKQQGAVMVETTLMAIVFVVTMFSLFQLALTIFHQVGLQHALYRAGRFASLGVHLPGLTRSASVEQTLIRTARDFGIALDPSKIQICRAVEPDCTETNVGNSGELILLRAKQPVMVFGRPLFDLTREVTVLNHNF